MKLLRVLFSLIVVTLIGGSAALAPQIDRDSRPERALAVTLIVGAAR